MVSNPQFLAGEKLSAEKLQLLGFQDTYTPVLSVNSGTNPSLGTGPIQDGFVVRSGNRVDIWVWIKFGSSPSAGSGTFRVSVPTSFPISVTQFGGPVGTIWLQDSSVASPNNVRLGVAIVEANSGTLWMRTTSDNNLVTNSAPWTWAENDIISLHASYPID